VQVNVEYLLAGRLAVGQEEVYPLAPEAACTKRCGDPLDNTQHTGAGVFGQLRQGCGVIVGHDEDVTRVYGLDVHERGATGVARNHILLRSATP
jgi:hypothetical protein